MADSALRLDEGAVAPGQPIVGGLAQPGAPVIPAGAGFAAIDRKRVQLSKNGAAEIIICGTVSSVCEFDGSVLYRPELEQASKAFLSFSRRGCGLRSVRARGIEPL